MGQISLLPNPYKYIIDTSSLLSQKSNDKFNRNVHKSLWENIDNLIREQVIVVSSENADEIKDSELQNYLPSLQGKIIDLDDNIQEKAKQIINEHPSMLDFHKQKSSGDVFLIASALEYNLTIITEESTNSPKKIPQIASCYKLESIDINNLCEKEGWVF